MPSAVINFNIWPGKANEHAKESKLYYKVVIAESQEQFDEYYFNICRKKKPTHVHAASFIAEKPHGNMIGYLLLDRGKLDIESISHEAAHLTAGYLKVTRKSLNLQQQNAEETFAHTVGRCSKKIVDGLVRVGLAEV